MARPALALLPAVLFAAAGTSSLAAAQPRQLHTSTLVVEDALWLEDALWVATRGGLEEYDAETWARRRVLTTADGLDSPWVRSLAADARGLRVRTAGSLCRLGRGTPVIACEQASPLPPPIPATADQVEGARVTVTIAMAGLEVLGTAGRGVFVRRGARLESITPRDQICSNHLVAIAAWRGRVWLGSFDEGLCTFESRRERPRFQTAPAPVRMVNDLEATPSALFVAGAEGLFETRDGQSFRRVPGVLDPSFTDLAWDAASRTLWATSVNALWRIPVGRRGLPRAYYRPGGTRSLQAVAVGPGGVWMAAEDRGAILFRGGRFEVFDRATGLPSSWGLDIAVGDDGAAYLGTLRHGLVRIAPDGSPGPGVPAPDPWLLHVSRDPRGGLLVGTQSGASRLAPDGAQTTLAGLPDPRVHVLARVGADLWVGTEGGTAVY
jgi:ligand-binding sensor domain-containing protein